MYVILYNIRSTYNVGAIFRTADAVGVEKIYLTGYTPAPLDRFGRARKDIHKAALGAEETVAWESASDIGTCIDSLKQAGVAVVAVEQTSDAISYKDYEPNGAVAFIFGNEVGGVPEEILRLADQTIEIPMRGKKESLNVSVATGVVLFHVSDLERSNI